MNSGGSAVLIESGTDVLRLVSPSRTVMSSVSTEAIGKIYWIWYAFKNLRQVRDLTSDWVVEYNYDRGHDSLVCKSSLSTPAVFPLLPLSSWVKGRKGKKLLVNARLSYYECAKNGVLTKVIKPGEKGIFKFNFSSEGKIGLVTSYVTISFKEKSNPIVLKLKGYKQNVDLTKDIMFSAMLKKKDLKSNNLISRVITLKLFDMVDSKSKFLENFEYNSKSFDIVPSTFKKMILR